jgi:hypothetical protein
MIRTYVPEREAGIPLFFELERELTRTILYFCVSFIMNKWMFRVSFFFHIKRSRLMIIEVIKARKGFIMFLVKKIIEQSI